VLLLFEKKKLSLRSPARERDQINLSYLGIRNSIICLFAIIQNVQVLLRGVPKFFFFRFFFTTREDPTQQRHALFSFSFGLLRARSIDYCERRADAKRARYEERKKGRLFLARARARAFERKREREVRGRVKIRSLHFSGILPSKISLWRFNKEYNKSFEQKKHLSKNALFLFVEKPGARVKAAPTAMVL